MPSGAAKVQKNQPVNSMAGSGRSSADHSLPQQWGRSPYLFVMLLAVLTILLFSRFIFSDDALLGSDTMANLDGAVSIQKNVCVNHVFPMWSVCRLGGMPSNDAGYGDVFYPPTLLCYALFPVHRAIGFRLVLHVFLAGLFFFLLLHKGFRAPAFVSFMGAAFYMLNPEFVSHVYPGHDGKMFVIAWLPFIVWRLKALMDDPTFFNSTLLGLGVAIMLYTGHVQMSYFTLWGLFLYWVAALVLRWRKEKKLILLVRPAAYFWLAVFIGLGMALVSLYPSFAFVRDAFSVRGVERGFDYAASWSLHWPETLSLWVPEFGNYLDNYWSENAFKLNTEYAGAAACLLAVLAIIARPTFWRWFWGGIAAFAVLYGLGAHTPFYSLAYALIPGVRKFRAASMIMFWFSMAAVLLSSLFLFDVARNRLSEFSETARSKWTKGLLIAIAACTALAILFSMKGFVLGIMTPLVTTLGNAQQQRIFDQNFGANFVPFLWVWLIFAATILGLLAGLVNGKVSKPVFFGVVLCIGLVDVFRVDAAFIKVVDPRPYFHADPALKQLAGEMKQEPFRCFSFPGALPQNGEGIYGLEGVGGFHDNELQWYRAFRGDQRDQNYYTGLISQQNGSAYLNAEKLRYGNIFLDLANAKYYLARQNTGILVIRNEAAFGRLSFARNYVVMDTAATAVALRNSTYDPKTTVALTVEPAFKPSPAAMVDSSDRSAAAPLEVAWQKYSVNYRKARVTAKDDGFLRISEVYYPGWEVKIDGQPERVYQADLAWMAVAIRKGTHTVEMIPHSLYLRKVAYISLPLIGLLLLYWIMFCCSRMMTHRSASKGLFKA